MRTNNRCAAEKIRNDEEIKERFAKQFDSFNLGRRVECGIYGPSLSKKIKGIVKDKTLCYVCEADFLGFERKETCETYTITRCFLAEEKGAFSNLMFMFECDKMGAQFIEDRTAVVFENERISLKPNTNIFNMYEMRFELRNHPDISAFMDDFVMTDFNVRDCYRQYESEQLSRLNMAKAHAQKGR